MSTSQLAIAIVVLALTTLVFGGALMWVMAWLIATPIRVIRDALAQVEQGQLHSNLEVFDGTELGALQSGFNTMVAGLRERERVRDLFSRHVGEEVAAAAEQKRPQLGGEERRAAVIFVDIIGSTQLVTRNPASEVVTLLNRFFAVIVDEVNTQGGLINKFEGDACLAVFGAPNELANPEAAALSAVRSIIHRLKYEVPECPAGVGVASGQVIAGNVGARQHFEYTVIGEPVNEAARLCEMAKTHHSHLLASAITVRGAGYAERQYWSFTDPVLLRGHQHPT